VCVRARMGGGGGCVRVCVCVLLGGYLKDFAELLVVNRVMKKTESQHGVSSSSLDDIELAY
jgi:hypothetical protein